MAATTTDIGMIINEGLSATATTTPKKFTELYNKLYPVAFSDAVHDKIVEKQQIVNASTHKTQCNYFNVAMPPTPPDCQTPDYGLNIEDAFKAKPSCEKAVWRSIVEAGFTVKDNKKDMAKARNGTHSEFKNSTNKSEDPSSTCHTMHNIPGDTNLYVMKTFNNKVYNVRKVQWNGNTGVKSDNNGVIGLELGKKIGLFDNPIGGTYKAFVVHDCDTVKLFDQLKHPKAPSSPNAILYYLMLPEYMADSASHKPWKKNPALCANAKGVKILWAGKIKSNYPAWSNNNRNTFFSRFSCNIEVTNWQKIKVKQEWRPTGPTGPTGPVIQITDASKDNNKGGVTKYIKTTTNLAEIQLALQRKRSGDQTQALAVKRLNNYEEFHVSSDIGEDQPSNGCARDSFTNVKSHAWLITHDFNLCSYALFLGINVLHTHDNNSTKVKTVTSFKLISPITDNFN